MGRDETSTNGLAVASLVLGLIGFLWITPVLAIIFGVIGRRQIRDSDGRQTGSGMATAGLVLGIVWLAVLAVLVVVSAISQITDRSSPPTRVEFVARFSEAVENDTDFAIESYPDEVVSDVRLAIQDFASCGYDVLQDNRQYLEAVFEDPTADEYVLVGLPQSRIDELDERFDRVCVDQFQQDMDNITGG